MAALKNARHERFAQALAKGQSADEAYQTAGYAENRGNAARLKANEHVLKRVEELTERAADKAVLSKAWVLERLRQNAETCMALDFVRDPNGEATATVTHNPAAANKALELLGKELGMFIDRAEIGKPGDFERMTDDELARFIARAAADLGGGGVGNDEAPGQVGMRGESSRVH